VWGPAPLVFLDFFIFLFYFINKIVRVALKKRKRIQNAVGRGTKYREFMPRQALIACSELGATERQLAKLFNVVVDQITKWKRKYPEFKEAIVKGRDAYDNEFVESALKKRALGYSYDEVTEEEILLKSKKVKGLKRVFIPAIKKRTTTKEVIPDVNAQQFWLTIRNPKRWKEIKTLEIEQRTTMYGIIRVPIQSSEEDWNENADRYRREMDSLLVEKNEDGVYQLQQGGKSVQRS